MSIWSTAKKFLNPEKYMDEEEYDEDSADEYEDDEDSGKSFSKRSKKSEKKSKKDKFSYDYDSYSTNGGKYDSASRFNRNVQAVLNAELYVITSESFNGSADIVKDVKAGKIVIFDVSPITTNDEARRVVDYISGAAEGMECSFSRLFPCIFCIAPKGVTINVRKTKYR